MSGVQFEGEAEARSATRRIEKSKHGGYTGVKIPISKQMARMKQQRPKDTPPIQPPDWMRKHMLEGANPWERIETRLHASEMSLDEARWIFFDVHKWAFLRKETFLKADAPTSDLKQNLIHHLNVALDLLPMVKKGIEKREFNAHFVWLWGAFVEAVSIVEALTPYYEQIAPTEKKSYEKEKFEERKWFSLWFINTREKHEREGKSISKEEITKTINSILQDIWNGTRDTRKEHRLKVTALLRNMAANPDDPVGFSLTGNFTNKFRQEKLDLYIREVTRDPEGLPPAMENAYTPDTVYNEDY